ncbi:hypothetical protein BKA62DRAFT_739828 [Auriculariales sp. MPI-PUGE-AT-0066]|nr:hypothetical protein BKA62DRAFT_739828 [Auriculariales sp. MPI-PUGE-AT-0066]
MVNWEDPHVLALSIRAYILFVHLVIGAYLWEYLLTLDFDWSIIRRRRKLNLGIILYLLPRYATLFVAFVAIRLTNAFKEIDCTAWNYVQHGSAYVAVSLASALLYARVWALSDGHPLVVYGIGFLYVGNWAMVIYGTYFSYGQYVPQMYICAAVNLEPHRWNALYQLVFDLACLGTMLLVLIRMHHGGSLWRLLVQQGILYFVAICLVYILHLTFLSLHLNHAVAQMPSALRVIVTCVAATRMQRGLIEFVEKRPVITTGGVGSGIGTFSREQMHAAKLQANPSFGVTSPRSISFTPGTVNMNGSHGGNMQISVNVNTDTWQHETRMDRNREFDQDVYGLDKIDTRSREHRGGHAV